MSEDNLYKFKAAFNKNSDYRFFYGKQIFNQAVYDELVRIRRESDASFDETSGYFPVYRAQSHHTILGHQDNLHHGVGRKKDGL